MHLAEQPEKRGPHILSRVFFGTRSLFVQGYERLPVKAPTFVEQQVKRLDEMAAPVVMYVSGMVDDRLDPALEKLTPLKDAGQNKLNQLKEQGLRLTHNVQEQSSHLLTSSVDLALHNKASQLVLDSADAISNKVFSSIEDRIRQLTVLVKMKRQELKNQNQFEVEVDKRGSLKSYHHRVLHLAQDISQISNHLYGVLREEMTSKKPNNKLTFYLGQAKSMVQAHIKTTFSVFKISIVGPTLVFVTHSKQHFRQFLEVLKEKMTEKQLVEFLKQQLHEARGQLTRQQLQNIYTVLKQQNYIEKIREVAGQQSQLYRQLLNDNQLKEIELEDKNAKEEQLDKEELLAKEEEPVQEEQQNGDEKHEIDLDQNDQNEQNVDNQDNQPDSVQEQGDEQPKKGKKNRKNKKVHE